MGADGARHLMEPIVELAWAESSGDPTPNEDSTVVEFDEGNLFALSRFPGRDRREHEPVPLQDRVADGDHLVAVLQLGPCVQPPNGDGYVVAGRG